MSDERWVVEVPSAWLHGVWVRISPEYVSERVARLSIAHHWLSISGQPLRIRRVA